MIVQFFNRGKGGGSGPIDYLLGKERDREKAELLRGNPDETAAIIDGSPYAKKYTAGVLSFEESDITPEQKNELMDSFEECIFAGLDRNQYNCLWVQHQDKGRLELNFVIPNIELLSGKRLQPYYHAADHKRVDAWRTMQNIRYGFSDPDDPQKRQNLTHAKDLPKSAQEAQEAITDGLMSLALAGQLKNRTDVLKTLENAGFEISRTTATSISIKNPETGGRNIRLKGALYEQDFRFSQDLSAELEARSARHRATSQERYSRAADSYQRGVEAKRAENHRRYSRPADTHEPRSIQTLSVELGRIISPSVGTDGREHFSSMADTPRVGKLSGSEAEHRETGRSGQANSDRGLQRQGRQDSYLRSNRPEIQTMGQERRISRDFATSGQEIGVNHDRDRNHAIERARTLGEQSEADRAENTGRIAKVGSASEYVGERKRAITQHAAEIQRTISATERNFEEAKRNHYTANQAIEQQRQEWSISR